MSRNSGFNCPAVSWGNERTASATGQWPKADLTINEHHRQKSAAGSLTSRQPQNVSEPEVSCGRSGWKSLSGEQRDSAAKCVQPVLPAKGGRGPLSTHLGGGLNFWRCPNYGLIFCIHHEKESICELTSEEKRKGLPAVSSSCARRHLTCRRTDR